MKKFGETLHDSFVNTAECQILTLLTKRIHRLLNSLNSYN
ncbi:hypothetical protein FGIG_08728 [Fasciola gigantica]|uniref:Uncharacterized protein n=1 Tax=Fasciola gigantica TaxID=46835 RepID=A0A504YM26_FASGI|nr:hypothetical protein FGIG_08728 [Fasciola gigantica]